MKIHKWLGPRAALIWLLSAVVAAPLASGAPFSNDDEDDGGATADFVQNEVIARVFPGVDIGPIADAIGLTVLESAPALRAHRLAVPPLLGELVAIALLEADPGVEFAELNLYHLAPGGSTQSFFVSSLEGDFLGQWAWETIGLRHGQRIADGRGVVVAVLDTGADKTHPLLEGHIAPGGTDFVDDDDDPDDTPSFTDADQDGFVDEMLGHGTFMSGIIAGMAPRASILPVRVLDGEGRGTSFDVAQGVSYAGERRVDVINMSLGTIVQSLLVDVAIGKAVNRNVVIIAAAGNSGENDPPEHPAANPKTIAVAGTDRNDRKTEFSNFGGHVTICAPALDIVSAVPGAEYGRADGTSMSCAIVSGALALAISAPPDGLGGGPLHRLLFTARPLDTLNPLHAGELGVGRVRVGTMLDPAGSWRRPAPRAGR